MAYLPELLGNGAIILGITVLTSVWDLSNRGRRFPWAPVVFSAPFLALVFFDFNETPESAAGEIARMKAAFDGAPGDAERIEFLVNYLGPRTTRGEWRKLSSS